MKHVLRASAVLCTLLVSLTTGGCAYITMGRKLAPITPPRPGFQPAVEYTVGDYSYTLEGGKMTTSEYAGHALSEVILESWKEHAYIRDFRHVEAGAFTGTADYEITMSGSQYGASSVGMQIVSGLTLFLLPYSVAQSYDIQYTLRDRSSDTKYSASVQEANDAYVELFLIFALPFGLMNQHATMARMADHLYDQLYRQGAFQRSP